MVAKSVGLCAAIGDILTVSIEKASTVIARGFRSLIGCRGRLVSAVGAFEGQKFGLGAGFIFFADQAHTSVTARTLRVVIKLAVRWLGRIHVHPFPVQAGARELSVTDA